MPDVSDVLDVPDRPDERATPANATPLAADEPVHARRVAAALIASTIAEACFDAHSLQELSRKATALYHEAQRTRARYERIGMAAGHAILQANEDEIREHLLYCAALERRHQIHVNPNAHFGQPPDAIARTVATLASARQRGRGARTVRARYGDQAAVHITGHHVRP